MEYRRQLIDLYAKYEASEVTKTPEYEQLQAQYGQQSQFRWLRSQLQDMKTDVEARIEAEASPKEQLAEAIHLLRGYRRRESERDLFYDLIVAKYGAGWGVERMAYLETALAAVRLPRDYFLSFTGRHSSSGINPINARYKFFILGKLQRTLTSQEQKGTNLFAEAINEIFKDRRLVGYFYPKSEDDTAIVEDELKREVNQCMVFVQIIQAELFQYSENKNYCYEEWKWAKGRFLDKENHILYLSGEPDRVWTNLPPDAPYLQWHSHARAKRVAPTPLHRLLNKREIERTTEFFEVLRDRVILGAWDRLELDAP